VEYTKLTAHAFQYRNHVFAVQRNPGPTSRPAGIGAKEKLPTAPVRTSFWHGACGGCHNLASGDGNRPRHIARRRT
jgi:hypothetical protein